MSDDANKKGNGESAPAAGELLARARRAREISLAEMAKALHLDEAKVRALEQNEFEALGAPVFAKGYLRKYAELVGVSEDDVIADYYRLNRSAGAPPLITKRALPDRDFSAGPWIGGIGGIGGLAAVLVIVLAGAWWFSSGADWLAGRRGTRVEAPVTADEPAARASANESERAESEAAEREADPALTSAPDPASVTSTDTTAASPAETALEPETRPSPEPAADGTLSLRLAFSGDCWTEVTDGDGRRLYFGLGTGGDEVTVAGSPPLNVLLGDSENVSVFVNGTAYPIPASARRGETARLTLIDR